MKKFMYFILIFSLIIPPDAADALAPESARFESAVRSDRAGAELLSNLFKWARSQKANISLDAIKRWFKLKDCEPAIIEDMFVVSTYYSTVIIYPTLKYKAGTRLPNSGYRVLWIPKSIDVKDKEDVEAVFRNIDDIRVAEMIFEKLFRGLPVKNIIWGKTEGRKTEGGGMEDVLVLNPTVFFWTQNMLKRRYNSATKCYELERKLFFSVLFQQYPDLDKKIKRQLEAFSIKCASLENDSVLKNGSFLVEADRFILSRKIYENPGFPDIVKALAERAGAIYKEIDEFSDILGIKIEKNSAKNFYKSLNAIARVIHEFSEEKDFLNPEKIAARIMSYVAEGQGNVDIFGILKILEKELAKYRYANIKGLISVLGAIRRALRREQKVTLEDLQKGILGGVLIEFFQRIQKADPHHHLDGSISPDVATPIQRLNQLIHDITNKFTVFSQYIELSGLQNELAKSFFTKYKDVREIFGEYSKRFNTEPVSALDYFYSKISVLREIGNLVLAHDGEWEKMFKAEYAQSGLRAVRRFLALLSDFEIEYKEMRDKKVDMIKFLRDRLSIGKCLVLDLPEGLPSVFAPYEEAHALLKIFICMISNSVHAGSSNVTIRMRISGNILKITIEDNGAGINEEHLQILDGTDRPWIFVAGNTTKTHGSGEHGQGLSYVWDTVVGKWGGKISVESVVGKGAKFILNVPIVGEEKKRLHCSAGLLNLGEVVDVGV